MKPAEDKARMPWRDKSYRIIFEADTPAVPTRSPPASAQPASAPATYKMPPSAKTAAPPSPQSMT
jgi:hypothetical protein